MQKRLLRTARRLVPQRYVVVHGFFGEGNVGDEAILRATLHTLRERRLGEPYVFCTQAAAVRRDHGVPALNPAVAPRREVLRVLLGARAYLLGGGGLLKDYGAESRRSLERTWLSGLTHAQRLGVPTMTWSVGVENLRYEGSIQALRAALEQTDVVTVRDEASAERLREIGCGGALHVTADPVPHLVRGMQRPSRAGARKRIVVAPRHWYPFDFSVPDEAANERTLTGLAQALDALAVRHGADVVFVPFRTSARDDDRAVCRDVAQRMASPARIVAGDRITIDAALEEIAQADLLVGMRLHALVMGTTMGIPSIGLAYMPKVADYMAAIGQSAHCFPYTDLDPQGLVRMGDALLRQPEPVAAALRAATAEAAQRYETNGRLLGALLGHRPSHVRRLESGVRA